MNRNMFKNVRDFQCCMDTASTTSYSQITSKELLDVLPQWLLYMQGSLNKLLGGGFKYFLCSPLPGEMIQFDEHIFQMGGSTTNQIGIPIFQGFKQCKSMVMLNSG